MNDFAEFLLTIPDPVHREKLQAVLDRIADAFPTLGTRIAWNQPMFTDHGTFILAFSASKNHFSVAPEKAAIDKFLRYITDNNIYAGIRCSLSNTVAHRSGTNNSNYISHDKHGKNQS